MATPIQRLPEVKLLVSRRKYIAYSLFFFFVVFILHLAFLPLEIQGISKFAKSLSFRHELNLPTFLSSVNLYIGAFLSFSLFRSSTKFVEQRFWAFVLIIFSIMGFDEAAGLHEYYGSKYFKSLTFGIPKIEPAWLNFYIPIVLIIGAFMLLQMFQMRNISISSLFLPCLLFLLGAVGLEALNFELQLTQGISGAIIETIEESIEMLAIIWINSSLIKMLEERSVSIALISSKQ